MSSLAEEFFKRIMAGQPTPTDFLKSLVNSTPPTFEGEWRDFKGKPRHEDLNEIWSKALSAFSNTEGGVLIWGIDARPDPATKVDAASGLNLISNSSQFKSHLLQVLHEATDPPTQGVQIEEIPESSPGGQGFVVCLIPESDQKPIRAELVENKPYFIRSGTSSKVINRSLLRSLFYPQTRSRLSFHVAYERIGVETGKPYGQFRFELRNAGPASAQEVVVRLEPDPRFPITNCHAITKHGSMAYVKASEEDHYSYYAYYDSLHPGMKCLLFQTIVQPLDQWQVLQFTLTVYARDREMTKLNVSFGPDSLRSPHDEIDVG